MPQALNPASGFVATANNDPGRLTADGSLTDDTWYIGGPWSSVRAHTIAREIQEHIDAGTADLAAMSEIQGNQDSRLGEVFAPHFVAAVAAAKEALANGNPGAPTARLAEIYEAEAVALDDVAARLSAWGEAGYHAASGVETFYESPTAAELEHSVATILYNAAFARFQQAVFNDEPLGNVWLYSSSRMKVRALRKFLEGRGADNPSGLASWDVATGESVFFDVYSTPEIERADELLVTALVDTLNFLRGEPTGPGQGGFGTDDRSAWLWGLRHQAKFESLLASFLSGDPLFGALVEAFSITTDTLPLAPNMEAGDPRAGLKWFPRGGDQWGIDAANPGFGGTSFNHGSGPVMRMVVSLKGDEVSGVNILPGGQSGLSKSDHFADQLEFWLANDTIPLRYHLEDVVAGAMGREVLAPAPASEDRKSVV
jgi:penicillin amidase